MKQYLYLVVILLCSPLVLGAPEGPDDFLGSDINDRLDALPGEFMGICKAETTAGLDYIELKVNSKLKLLPAYIGLSAGFGVLVGLLMGLLVQMVVLRKMLKRINKTQKDLTAEFKLYREAKNG